MFLFVIFVLSNETYELVHQIIVLSSSFLFYFLAPIDFLIWFFSISKTFANFMISNQYWNPLLKSIAHNSSHYYLGIACFTYQKDFLHKNKRDYNLDQGKFLNVGFQCVSLYMTYCNPKHEKINFATYANWNNWFLYPEEKFWKFSHHYIKYAKTWVFTDPFSPL